MIKRRFFILLLVLVVFGGWASLTGWRTAQSNMAGSIQEILKAHGFQNPRIGDLAYENNWLIYSDIMLDQEGFSTIDAISSQAGPGELLLGAEPGYLVIDGVRLSGDYSSETGLNISGWEKQPLPVPRYDDILLNGGQLDIMTSEGALRIQAKGIGKKEPDGKMAVKAKVWALQNQLKFETSWDGHIFPDGRWITAVEIADAGINFKEIQASRMNGWLTIDKTENVIPHLSGQVDAGKMTVGDLNFSNFRLTLNGPFNNHTMIARGEVSGYEDMVATLEIENSAANGPQVRATVETAKIGELTSFLADLRNSDTEAGAFTSLLLTKGNLDRLRKDISRMSYDALELEIYGPLYDMAGKVIVKTFKDGVTERRIISLNPGDSEEG